MIGQIRHISQYLQKVRNFFPGRRDIFSVGPVLSAVPFGASGCTPCFLHAARRNLQTFRNPSLRFVNSGSQIFPWLHLYCRLFFSTPTLDIEPTKARSGCPFRRLTLFFVGPAGAGPFFSCLFPVVYISQRFLSSSSAAPPQRVRPARVYIQVPEPPVEGSSTPGVLATVRISLVLSES